MAFIDTLEAIQESTVGVALAESQFAFPIIEAVHLVGLAVSTGLLLFIDLRLIGVFLRGVPVADIHRQLKPWMLWGFVSTFVSGVLLFWSEAARVWESPAFIVKLVFILFATLNALWFEYRWGRSAESWGGQAVLPLGAVAAGWASLLCWGTVIVTGRLIPYIPN